MSRTLKSIIIVILIFQNCCCYYYCFFVLLPFFLVITSSTCMLTSTTCKPVIYLTCSFTNSVTLRKILVLIHHILRLLLSRLLLVFRQLLVVTLFPLENALVKLSAKPPFISKIPLTSRAAIPAIFLLLHLRKLICFQIVVVHFVLCIVQLVFVVLLFLFITFKSIAACFSPTSTETPVVTLFPLENALVKLSAKPPFISKIPLTSRAAIPAIFLLLHLRKLICFQIVVVHFVLCIVQLVLLFFSFFSLTPV